MVTGITIMQMDKGLDTGDMLSKVTTGISADETGGSLHDRLAEMGPPALLDTLAKLEAGELKPEIQNDMLACYAHKLSKEEALLDWNLSASELDRKVRAFNPFPMAYTLLGDNRIRVFQAEMLEKVTDMLPGTIVNVSPKGIEVACSENVLRISTVQLPGKKAMSVADVINGQPQLFQVNHMLASQH